jgi:selenocysteine-specific elongation factor
MDIRSVVADTVMQAAPLVRVSAKTGLGLDDLLQSLTQLLEAKPARLDLGRPRLPIDRVFTMSGFGTVVTGTLSDGVLSVGDEVHILPSGLAGRVRGLQTHKKKEEISQPGSRTAVNISGIAMEDVQRGQVVVHPHQYQSTRRLDARFRLLKDASSALKHGSEVKVFVGASETIAMLRLLGVEELLPGEAGWIQLELRDPVVTVRGDRYILRRPSPGETLGGGMIVDHQPKGRHKRMDESVLKSLESLSQGSPSDVLFEAALALNAASLKEMVARSRLESAPAGEALTELLASGKLILLEEGAPSITSDLLALALPHWNSLREKTLQIVAAYHQGFPLRRGIPREELKSKLKLQPRIFNAIVTALIQRNLLIENRKSKIENSISLPSHEVRFDGGQQAKAQALLRQFAASPYAPPSVKECQAEVGEELLNALVDSGQLIAISQEVIFRKSDYEVMQAKVRAALTQNGQITLAEVRDLFNTSRKYAQALLEYLDATGVTMRTGDFRKLRR